MYQRVTEAAIPPPRKGVTWAKGHCETTTEERDRDGWEGAWYRPTAYNQDMEVPSAPREIVPLGQRELHE
jgi:hypothetical protein